MKAIILGGIGTSLKHVTRTKNIYKNKGIEPIFYESGGLLGIDIFIKKKWNNKIKKITNEIKSENNNIPYILHCFSGSNFIGYEINSIIPANSIILESSPTQPSEKCFQNFINVTYGIKIPEKFIKLSMNTLKMPNDKDIQAHKWYCENKPKKNTTILVGAKDKLLNIDYIEKNYISPGSNNEMVIFENSGHCNISKYDNELYNKVLEKVISKSI